MTTRKSDSMARDWPDPSQFRRSIRFEFTLYVSGIILLLMLVTGWIISDQYVKTVTRNVVEKLVVQARSYSGPAGKLIISPDGADALLLNNICKKLADDNPEVYWAGIAGPDGRFLAHTDINQVIKSGKLEPTSSGQFREVLRPGESFDLLDDTICISVSIEENGIRLGRLAAAASAEEIKKARVTSIVTVASITIGMILLGIPATIVVLRRKLQPVNVIADHLRSIDFEEVSLNIPINSKNEFGYLAETMNAMGSKLNVAQKELIEKERMSRELEIAREIQANILPKGYPRGSQFEFAGTYRSAKEVGGDYYDFIGFDDHRLGILVADVSGKSLPGMLVMLLTRDIVKRLAPSARSPSELLSQANSELLGNINKGMFVTMFFGILDQKTGKFSFASAGHNPLILVRQKTGKVQLAKTKGFPLGLVASAAFEKRIESGEINLSQGDWLIQYTDGVNEAQNLLGEEFGLERFIRMVELYSRLKPPDFVQQVLREHERFVGDAAQYDDITLLTIKWTGQTADIKTKVVQEKTDVG